MTKITKEYPLLNESDDFYFITSISVIGDLEIELDKRLHVTSSIVVAGNIKSNVEVIVNEAIVCDGDIELSGIQAGKAKMLGRIKCDGDFLSKESAILGPIFVSGDMMCYGKLITVSEVRVDGNLAIQGTAEFNYEVYVTGRLFVNGSLDPKSIISASETKINGVETKTIGRFLTNSIYCVLFGDGILLYNQIIGWRSYKNIDDAKNMLDKTDECSATEADMISELLKTYDAIKDLQFKIPAVN